MKKKTIKMLLLIAGIIAIVGGVVHVFQPLGFNLLSLFGSFGWIIQLIAGLSTVAFVGYKLMK